MSLAMSTTHDTEQQFSKTTLFCPTCEHASPIEGDWIMDDAVHRERLLCPRCGDVVVDQPST
ncbi:hypothetical protein ACFQL1_23975 [Halomicroarcula sp. GCM10025709]|uniref:hypothetical protein n=2 Tax=Haloarcula TaxID=2237 RepID=UPI00361C4F37